MKYGVKASSGGGRSSARETIARVAAGAVAEKWMKEAWGTDIVCWVDQVGGVRIPVEVQEVLFTNPPSREEVDTLGCVWEVELDGHWLVDCHGEVYDFESCAPVSPLHKVDIISLVSSQPPTANTRCVHPPTAVHMTKVIHQLKKEDDSIGGTATCVVRNCPVGLGEPCFEKLEALLAYAMLSLPATKGFEIGSGFRAASMRGSEHNDTFVPCASPLLSTTTNHAGGTLGGISTGLPIYFRVAIKPASSISRPQYTATFDGEHAVLEVKGRHDPCVLPRAPPLIEGMTSLVLADLALRQKARRAPESILPVLPDVMPVFDKSLPGA